MAVAEPACARSIDEADAVINLCGATRLRDEHLACPVRIMIDTDPVYEQIKYANADQSSRAYLDAHTHFFTYGENLGSWIARCHLCGVPWRPTRPPVIRPVARTPRRAPLLYDHRHLGEQGQEHRIRGLEICLVEAREFSAVSRFAEAPAGQLFSHSDAAAGRSRTRGGQWWRLGPRRSPPDFGRYGSYHNFIARSRGELTVAKDIYVRPNSGWFSDRSVCYLAAGRPVITMRTGFSKFYPVGRGLFEYSTHEEALAAIDAIAADYSSHSRAARELAREYFAADRVLGALLADRVVSSMTLALTAAGN